MKILKIKNLLSLSTIALLTACSSEVKEQNDTMVSMSNPASEFCVRNGGEIIIQKDPDGGEYGLCKLPDGTLIEEWEYFREHSKE